MYVEVSTFTKLNDSVNGNYSGKAEIWLYEMKNQVKEMYSKLTGKLSDNRH